MFLEFNNFAAPLVFKFKDPSTSYLYEASSMPELLSKIRGYRTQNGLEEIEFLETVVEDYLCRNFTEHNGMCRKKPPLKRGLVKVMQGGVGLVKNLMFKHFVSQEEADRRATICKGCKFNSFPDRGNFVKWSDGMALLSIGERRSKCHDDLGTCLVCQCPLRSKVWIGDKFPLSEKEVEEMQTVSCWQPEYADIHKVP